LRAQLVGQQLGDLFQERCELRVKSLLVAQKALRGGVDVLHAGHALGESHDACQQGQHLAHQAVVLLQHALCLFHRLERVLLEFPSLVREHAHGSQISERTDEVKVATSEPCLLFECA
jgi:coenzyme F420-reducing hydrogenase delta subunit